MVVHTRETRVSASEFKFVLSPDIAARIKQWARERLEPDSNGGGTFLDEYFTSSLYFDTSLHDVLYRRQSFGRAKYRIRRYGQSDLVFLERKLRTARMLVKRRTLSALGDLDRLRADDMDPGWPGYWFHRRLAVRKLGPVCQLNYARTARVLGTPRGLARLTVDDQITAAPLSALRFESQSTAPVAEGQLILELKFPGDLPGPFKDVIAEFRLEPQTISKYRLGMAALGHTAGRSDDELALAGVKRPA